MPLPPYGACNLGSLNIARFVLRPFREDAALDLPRLADMAALATRFLDNVIDVSHFPLAAQAAEARATRRLGLGISGLGDALVMLGLRYDSAEALHASGIRNSHLLAIAPAGTISLLAGNISSGIEPIFRG